MEFDPRRRRFLGEILGFGILTAIVACKKGIPFPEAAMMNLDKILADRGMLGEEELITWDSLREPAARGSLSGTLRGDMFLLLGDVSGKLDGNYQAGYASNLRFKWKTNTANPEDSLTVISEIPFNIALFQKIKSDEKPTVRFELNKDNLIKDKGGLNKETFREQVALDFVNPNKFLEAALLAARFRLPPDEYERLTIITR